jgi:hypothetical protein
MVNYLDGRRLPFLIIAVLSAVATTLSGLVELLAAHPV